MALSIFIFVLTAAPCFSGWDTPCRGIEPEPQQPERGILLPDHQEAPIIYLYSVYCPINITFLKLFYRTSI